MLKRLIVGLILGALLGAIAAAAMIRGLGITEATGGGAIALMYAFAAVTGALAGLVAGKPIWGSEAKVEAGLKAFFGALIAAGGMFAVRQWLHLSVDLHALGAGRGAIGDLPAASLPLLGALLAGFFEVDNTPGGNVADKSARAKSLPPNAKARVANAPKALEEDDEVDEIAPKKSMK